MDFGFTQEELEFRREIEAFVKDLLPPDWDEWVVYWPGSYGTMPQMETEFKEIRKRFSRMLGAKGWLSLGWPKGQPNTGGVSNAARPPLRGASAGSAFRPRRTPRAGASRAPRR